MKLEDAISKIRSAGSGAYLAGGSEGVGDYVFDLANSIADALEILSADVSALPPNGHHTRPTAADKEPS